MQHTAHRSEPLGTAGFAHPARNVAALGVQPWMKVADFGAGSGAYVFAIAELLAGEGTVYAIDIQKDLLRRIANEANHRHLRKVEVIWADLEIPGASKLADKSVDIVLISNILFQLDDKSAPFVEAKRILKPEGSLAVIDWSESFGGLGPTAAHVVTREKARQLAEWAGFGLVREFSAGAHHYGLMFKERGHRDAPRKVSAKSV